MSQASLSAAGPAASERRAGISDADRARLRAATETARQRQTFTLTIRDAAPNGPVPLMPRLRRLLKAMLRGYGIRCVSIRPTTETPITSQRSS